MAGCGIPCRALPLPACPVLPLRERSQQRPAGATWYLVQQVAVCMTLDQAATSSSPDLVRRPSKDLSVTLGLVRALEYGTLRIIQLRG